MIKIGGMFPLEPTLPKKNTYFDQFKHMGDMAFAMSGRCAMYYCLKEIVARDSKKVAYVPRYTCETVLAPYIKTGFTLEFYDLSEGLECLFDVDKIDEISVLHICGYYGFCNYDKNFVQACKDKGIVIFEDVTHSLLSTDGFDPLADFWAGSFRKWMGIPCGGFAVKNRGKFNKSLLPTETTHLYQRQQAIAQTSNEVFWKGELRLRQMFDAYASDPESEYILRHADLTRIAEKRRENYAALLADLPDQMTGLRPVFPQLPKASVPSHFSFYADQREAFQAFLADRGIYSTVYWPRGPEVHPEHGSTVEYIYDHIVSLPCDQRYAPDDMAYIARVIGEYLDA